MGGYVSLASAVLFSNLLDGSPEHNQRLIGEINGIKYNWEMICYFLHV